MPYMSASISYPAGGCSARLEALLLWRKGAHVAEPGGVDGSCLYGGTLVRLRRIVIQVRVEVRYPRKVAFDEAASEFATHLPGVVQPLLARPPGEVRLCRNPDPSLVSTRPS